MLDVDFWMGDGRWRWKATLVVDTVSLGDRSWLDEAGTSATRSMVERFAPMDPTINYEVAPEDPKVFTHPEDEHGHLSSSEKNLELLNECAGSTSPSSSRNEPASRRSPSRVMSKGGS
jgi:hypothetical protein